MKFEHSVYFAKQNDLGFYDTLSQSLLIQPSIYFEKTLLAFPTSYNHTIVDDRSYLANPSTGALLNHVVTDNQMAQLYVRYNFKNFLWTPLNDDEDRDSNELAAGMGWYWFFAQREGFFNLRYGYNHDATEGSNWEHFGNRVNAAILVPVNEKLNVTVAGSVFRQDFRNDHTVFGVEREDDVYTGSSLVSYEFLKDKELQFQYTYVKDNSNISVFTYDRNIYSAGVQMKF
jgi:hypothetical protein